MKGSKQYGIFEQVEFLNEDGILAPLLLTAAIAGAAALADLVSKRKRKEENDKKAAEAAKRAEEESKKKAQELESFIKDAKKHYGISVEKLTEDKNNSEDPKYYDMVLKDVKEWTTKIINSKIFKDYCTELLKDNDTLDLIKDEYGETYKPSYSNFKSLFKPKEGINGLKESIEICEGSQCERIKFGWINYDIARLVNYKYGFKVSTGDGDEGHIYY